MGSFSIWHWLVVLAVVLLLFGGKGKISSLMGDFGKGLKNFKQGMKSEDEEAETANKSVADESGEKQDVDKTTNQTAKS
ncbi:MAG: twin-arginine translocase TatA/TatE family subunit [Thalassobaculaceae bacterium]